MTDRRIMVDTNIWIRHQGEINPTLDEYLAQGIALMHPWVLAELALGSLPDRKETLADFRALPTVPPFDYEGTLDFIETRRVWSKGIGFVDLNLLAVVLDNPGMTLWTADKRLREVAEELNVSHQPTEQGKT